MAVSAAATVTLILVFLASPSSAALETRGEPPWPAPSPARIATGVHAAGLTLLTTPGVVVRFAVHLDVVVNGRAVTVPAGIGIDDPAHLIAPLFTTDTSGIIHVTSGSDASVFTLGQFFDEWQVRLATGRLGGLRGSRDDPVTVYLDGRRVTGNPAAIRLTPHLQIAVTYRPGTVRVPAGYTFPGGV